MSRCRKGLCSTGVPEKTVKGLCVCVCVYWRVSCMCVSLSVLVTGVINSMCGLVCGVGEWGLFHFVV